MKLFPKGHEKVEGPENLGESQARAVPGIGKTDFGNYDTSVWGKERNIKTTGGTGIERKYDRFYEKKTMQDFIDGTAKTYGKGGMTYGR